MNIDTLSLLVTVPTSMILKDFREKLRVRGYEFGFFSGKEAENCTLKNILEARIPNQWHLRHGEIDDLCMALIAKTSVGHVRTKKVPRSATGPDLKKIFIGSHHHYGDIQEATFQIIPKPETRKTITKKISKDFLKKLWASGVRPLTLQRNKSQVVIQLEGFKDIVAAEERLLQTLAKETR